MFTSDEEEPACHACEKSAWPYRARLVFHIAIATAETRHSPPHCAPIHCLLSTAIQQALMNVSGCHFFLHGGIQIHSCVPYMLLCQMMFCQTAPLLPSVAQQQNVM